MIPTKDNCCVPLVKTKEVRPLVCPFVDISLKKKWIAAFKRDEEPEFCVTNSTVICSEHFVGTDYTTGDLQGSATRPSRSGKTLRPLKKNAVFSFRPLSQCRQEPAVCINLSTTPLPKYGPPMYKEWLEDELKIYLANQAVNQSSRAKITIFCHMKI